MPSLCGHFDDEDFKANDMCCACQNENIDRLNGEPIGFGNKINV